MAIEPASYIGGLNEEFPEDKDLRSQGAAHLRLIKRVLKQTFPEVEESVTEVTAADLRRLVGASDKDDSIHDRLSSLEDRSDKLGSMANRDVTISSGSPTGGSDGDVWLRYE